MSRDRGGYDDSTLGSSLTSEHSPTHHSADGHPAGHPHSGAHTGAGSDDDGPIDLVELQADEELMNALSSGLGVSGPGGGHDVDDKLVALLASWRAVSETPPLPELVDVDTAIEILAPRTHQRSVSRSARSALNVFIKRLKWLLIGNDRQTLQAVEHDTLSQVLNDVDHILTRLGPPPDFYDSIPTRRGKGS